MRLVSKQLQELIWRTQREAAYLRFPYQPFDTKVL